MDPKFKSLTEVDESKKEYQPWRCGLGVSPNTPRGQWPMGRILEVLRSVRLQVGNKQYLRLIVKVCPLELN